FQMFHDWSEGSARFDTKAVKSTWTSFKLGGRVTIGRLIAEAKRNGFHPKDHPAAVPVTVEERAKAQRQREERDKAAEAATQHGHDASAAQAHVDWGAGRIQGV